MKTNIENNSNNDENLIDNNLLNFQEIFNIFFRRKKVILFTSAVIFLFSLINLAYKRIYKPQYLGTFSIMTRDPIIDKSRGPTGSGFFEDLAVNNTYSDIPTLIEYLKSEKVLSKTALKNNISPIALRNQICIL